MKKVIITLLVSLFFTSICSAEEDPCKRFSKFAEEMMRLRQDGASIVDIFEIIDENVKADDSRRLAKDVAIAAFEVPIAFSPSVAKSRIDEFRNKCFVDCFKKTHIRNTK